MISAAVDPNTSNRVRKPVRNPADKLAWPLDIGQENRWTAMESTLGSTYVQNIQRRLCLDWVSLATSALPVPRYRCHHCSILSLSRTLAVITSPVTCSTRRNFYTWLVSHGANQEWTRVSGSVSYTDVKTVFGWPLCISCLTCSSFMEGCSLSSPWTCTREAAQNFHNGT